MSRVKEKKHLRILLSKRQNKALEWESLKYVELLQRDKSIHAFFSGFASKKTNWASNNWNPTIALSNY